jgi:hypothetical protein
MPSNRASSTHLVLIPSYNPGVKVEDTVRSARAQWNPVWVVVDGSTDGSTDRLQAMAEQDPGLRVIVLSRNRGKGVAVLAGLNAAAAQGFTHVLTMDSDGQHPAHLIPAFMAASQAATDTMVLGLPKFDASAPQVRVQGRRLSNLFTDIETLWSHLSDRAAGRDHASPALDARLRLRSGSGRAPVLGGSAPDPSGSARALFPQGRGRRLALPLRSRQRAVGIDAPAAGVRLPAAPAHADRAALQARWPSPRASPALGVKRCAGRT